MSSAFFAQLPGFVARNGRADKRRRGIRITDPVTGEITAMRFITPPATLSDADYIAAAPSGLTVPCKAPHGDNPDAVRVGSDVVAGDAAIIMVKRAGMTGEALAEELLAEALAEEAAKAEAEAEGALKS